MLRAVFIPATIALALSWAAYGHLTDQIREEGGPSRTYTIQQAQQSPMRSENPPLSTFAPAFKPCAHCHQIGDGARNSVGPVLTGVVGRKAAATEYPYSQEMRRSGLTWDEATLRSFLSNPSRVVPGTRMVFEGLDDVQADLLITFLQNPRESPE